MTPTTRYLCPLDCGWHHDEPDPDYSDPTALHPFIPQDWAAGMDGMAAGFTAGQLAVVETAVREHLETHPLIEWAKKVNQLQQRLAGAEADVQLAISDVASEDEADEPDDGSGFRCPYCAGPTTYQAMSGGREWFCPACETTGDYPADQTPVRAALLRTEEGRVALREQVRQHLAGLRQQGVARPATPGDLP